MNNVLIGTGFFANSVDHEAKTDFFWEWVKNTRPVSDNIVVIDNSTHGLHHSFRDIRIKQNMGHVGSPMAGNYNLLGWSLSWILPALVAYSDGCDFIYKEQDCLAFGDWLPRLRQHQMTIGHSMSSPCEQSLFFIRHDFIIKVVAEYMAIEVHDSVMIPETKFAFLKARFPAEIAFHDLPGGRERPAKMVANSPFYYQQITPDELATLKESKLI
jgi:hypothetical protein